LSVYRFPRPLLLRIAWALATGEQRSLGADAAGGLRGAAPPPRALDTHCLPHAGPYVVVGNHYQREGLWAGWGAMVVSAAVWEAAGRRRELHWLMTAELLDVRLGPLPLPRRGVRAVLARMARVYRFGQVSARETGLVGGATGLRVAARYLAEGEPVGVLPEGTASIALQEARPGVGAFLAWLTRHGAPLVPVGIYEQDDTLTARFGPPFELSRPAGGKEARDAALRDAVMGRIARLLPPALRGPYALAAEAVDP